jgi:hypothetical protein
LSEKNQSPHPLQKVTRILKRLLTAIGQQTLWPARGLRDQLATSPEPVLLWGSVIGILAGIAAAAVFIAVSPVLPVRVAILLALLTGLSGSLPRANTGLRQAHFGPIHAVVVAVLLWGKLEILAEIDVEWIPVTLICGAAWSRAAMLAARRNTFIGLATGSTACRLGALVIGALPLLFFGVWPEPVWGLWVAAALTLLLARLKAPISWASPMGVRWQLSEALFYLCVLALLSAAALTDTALLEEPES